MNKQANRLWFACFFVNILNYVNYDNIVNTLAHKRIEKKEDLYDPLNIIIDTKVRDIAEYIKKEFFYGEIKLVEIKQFIISNIISKDEVMLLIARLIYPLAQCDTATSGNLD